MNIDFLENFDKEVRDIFFPFLQTYGFEPFEKTFHFSDTYTITFRKENLFLILSIGFHPIEYFDGISIKFKTWSHNLELTYLHNLTNSKRIYTFDSKGLNEAKNDLIEFASFYLTQFDDKELDKLVRFKKRKWQFW